QASVVHIAGLWLSALAGFVLPPHRCVIHKTIDMLLNVGRRLHDEFMNTSPRASSADDVDRHRQHLDAVRKAGPLAIAELLGDAQYVLANLVLAPGLVFDPEEHEPGEFV